MKRSVDIFPAPRGGLYLLRSGLDDEFVIPSPSSAERATVAALADGWVRSPDLMDALSSRRDRREALDAIATLEACGLVETEALGLLSAEEADRYDRQLIYFADLAAPGESGAQAQINLRDSTVVMLGCGGLGSWTACALACAGVGTLRLIDDDTVARSNLHRQVTFVESDIGAKKVDAAAAALQRHNSGLRVEPIDRRLASTEDVASVLDGADLLIATADWPPHELPRWVNEACHATRVPFITAGQFLPAVRIGPMTVPGETACLECLETGARETHPLYDALAEHRQRNPTLAATLGSASGMVGNILATEAIHFLGGQVTPATLDTSLIFDIRTWEMRTEVVSRRSDCPVCSILR